MSSPAEEVARTFGIPHEVYDRQAFENGQPSIELERLQNQVHRATANRAERRRVARMAKQSAVDQVHEIIKASAKKSDVPHAAFLNILADKHLKELNDAGADSNAGDETADPENGADDEGSMRSIQDEHMPDESTDNPSPRRPFKTRDPQSPPSPIDPNPSSKGWLPKTPGFSEQNRGLHTRATMAIPGGHGDRLLLNVSPQEFNRAREK